MKINLLCAMSALFLSTFSFGQNPVPNASFENWKDNLPDEWVTSNVPDGNLFNVTLVEPGFGSDHALKGEVIEFPGFPGIPYIPLLESNTSDFGFPVNSAYPYFTMHYQFYPTGAEDLLSVFVGVMDDQGSVIGGGFADISSPSDTFTLLNIPLTYTTGQPYRAFITLGMNSSNYNGFPEVGSYFIIDSLSLGDLVLPVFENKNRTIGQLGVYPNPARSGVNISFDLLENTQVSVGIYDLTGRKMVEVFSGELHDGSYAMPTDLEGLPSGIYFCRLTTDKGTMTQKIRVI